MRDKSVVATGYNGPPRDIPHCGLPRFATDKKLQALLRPVVCEISRDVIASTCPRRLLGYTSGTHMELCPAQHAEANCVSNAARLGVITLASTLYMNCVIPCESCMGKLINAGINEIVVDDDRVYDEYTQYLIDNSYVIIRRFDL